MRINGNCLMILPSCVFQEADQLMASTKDAWIKSPLIFKACLPLLLEYNKETLKDCGSQDSPSRTCLEALRGNLQFKYRYNSHDFNTFVAGNSKLHKLRRKAENLTVQIYFFTLRRIIRSKKNKL